MITYVKFFVYFALSLFIFFLLHVNVKAQAIKIEKPDSLGVYDLNKFPIEFSTSDNKFYGKEIKCKFLLSNKFTNSSVYVIDSIIVTFNDKGECKLILDLEDKLKIDTMSVSRLMIVISQLKVQDTTRDTTRETTQDQTQVQSQDQTQKTDIVIKYIFKDLNPSIVSNSKLFSVIKFSKYNSDVNRFEEVRNHCLYNCMVQNTEDYKAKRLAEISTKPSTPEDHQKEIKNLNDELKKMEENNNVVYSQYMENNFWRKNNDVFNLIPVADEIQAKIFYNDQDIIKTIQFLQNTNLSLNFDGNASLYSDIITTYWGPFRISFGNLVSNNANTNDSTTADTTNSSSPQTQQDAIQKLVGGGGNVLAAMIYPLAIIKSSQPSAINFPITRIKALSYAKVCYDIPGIGAASGDSKNINYQLGLNIDGNFGNKDISVIANFKYNFIGGTEGFRDYLGIGNGKGDFINLFKVDLGLNISNKFLVGSTFYFGSSYINNNFKSPTVFFTVLP